MPSSTLTGRSGVGLVEVFTAVEQRARTSQAYWRSAVGERLRVQDSRVASDAESSRAIVVQGDAVSGIEVRTTITAPARTSVVRIEHEVRNTGRDAVVLTALSSATIGFGRSAAGLDDIVWGTAASEWLAENRWSEVPLRAVLPDISLPLHAQDARGHAGVTSHGAWSSGEHVPCGYLRHAGGEALAWQIETSAGWHADLCQTRDGGVMSLLGPSDLEHQFAHELLPGETFATVPVAIAAVPAGGRDGAVAELTRAEHASIALTDRLRAVVGSALTLELLDGEALTGVLRRTATTWALLEGRGAGGPVEHLVPLASVAAVMGLSRHAVPSTSRTDTLGLGTVLRGLQRDRGRVVVRTSGGQLAGRVARVGGDHLDLEETDRTPVRLRTVPFASVLRVSQT
jgi:hypothetical protein